jgi:hypothetical protein
MTLREALRATDTFMSVADAEQDYDGGIPYRDALKGLLSAMAVSREDRVHILRAYDRLERYRSHINRKRFNDIVLPDGRKLSAASVRDAFAAQQSVLGRLYAR